MWGVIPAAGSGTRIQPLAFSRELLPVGSREDGGVEHPKAVSEYLVERLMLGGATKICFVIAPGKSDILPYYGGRMGRADIAYVVQPRAAGLCDAVFRACALVPSDEPVAVGLPDTVWFPREALSALPDDRLSFLLFPVEHPELFDAVVMDEHGRIERIEVKSAGARSRWIWGAFKMPGRLFHELRDFWHSGGRREEYAGTLINAWLAAGGSAWGVCAGESYVDVGTLNGYRQAIRLLSAEHGTRGPHEASGSPRR
jgi:dTDP-glucose pyrophosphorylase